jgi:hypothetical protein
MAGLDEQLAELRNGETQSYLAGAIEKIVHLKDGEAALVTGTGYDAYAEERLRRRVQELRKVGLNLDESGRVYGFYMKHLQDTRNVLGLVVFRGPLYDIENANIEELKKLRGFVVRKKTGDTNHAHSIADLFLENSDFDVFDSTRMVAIDSNSYFHFIRRAR